MRSLASALQLLTTALGSYVATAVTTIINDVSLWLSPSREQSALLACSPEVIIVNATVHPLNSPCVVRNPAEIA